jgi:hypothetical protein
MGALDRVIRQSILLFGLFNSVCDGEETKGLQERLERISGNVRLNQILLTIREPLVRDVLLVEGVRSGSCAVISPKMVTLASNDGFMRIHWDGVFEFVCLKDSYHEAVREFFRYPTCRVFNPGLALDGTLIKTVKLNSSFVVVVNQEHGSFDNEKPVVSLLSIRHGRSCRLQLDEQVFHYHRNFVVSYIYHDGRVGSFDKVRSLR